MACRNAEIIAVTPHHQTKEPVKTPVTVRRADVGSKPDFGASAVKIAANIMIVGGFVNVSKTELAKADRHERATLSCGAVVFDFGRAKSALSPI
jgi:hypothetical protein